MQFRTVWQAPDRIVSSPVWLPEAQTLLMCDTAEGALVHHDPASGRTQDAYIGHSPSFVHSTHNGRLVFGSKATLQLVDREGAIVREEIIDTPATRTLYATPDPVGRLWFGMSGDGHSEDGGEGDRDTRYGLYRYHDARLVQMLFDCRDPGGIAFSPDGRRMMFADGTRRRIEAFAVSRAGSLSSEGTLVDLSGEGTVPGDIAFDLDGRLWVGFAGGGDVRAYDASGACVERADTGGDGCTGLCFGGEDLRHLYVTVTRGGGSAVLCTDAMAFAGAPVGLVKLGRHGELGLVDDDEEHAH